MHSHFNGILLGYLPHRGEYEFKIRVGGVIHGLFTDHLKSITMNCPSYYNHFINKDCRFFIDDNLLCDRIELNETAYG